MTIKQLFRRDKRKEPSPSFRRGGPLELYLHIPFCVKKCNYCDFCSFPGLTEEREEAFVRETERRLVAAAKRARGYQVTSVYFGGGTPTLLSADSFAALMDTIDENYVLTDPEITAECNPGTASRDLLFAMRKCGINRLSIGLQSVNPNELQALGRIHTLSDFNTCVQDARDAGFTNLSFDLMFGIPEETRESFQRTLNFALSRSPQHLSVYGLKIEEGTPFYNMRSTLPLPDEDEEEAMYEFLVNRLARTGMEQYEISNFALPGYHSRHNLGYWTGIPYLGFGPSAHSYFEGVRFSEKRDIEGYLRGEDITEEKNPVSEQERENDYIMLRFRLLEGISELDFEKEFGKSFAEVYGGRMQIYLDGGFALHENGRYALTPRGMRVSNTILSDLLDL